MVKKFCFKRGFWLAITLFVIASLALGSYIFAKQLDIKAADVERIKTALGMAQTVATAADVIINNKDLSTVLNTVLKGGTAGVDVTYGLVVLGALNEMDLVDLVVSGRYRDEARGYFNNILDQTTDLTSYWKDTSQNIFSLMRRGGAVTPTTGLAMESVAILEKTMSILVSAKVWLIVETYNGMWRYFQDRMSGDNHKDAWYFAEAEMGYVPEKENDIKTSDGWRSASYREKQILQLEPQFAEMYDKWEPYVTPFGISEEYKKQVKNELNNTLIAAMEENRALVEKKPESSLLDKLVKQLENIKNSVAGLISRINPFKAGVALNLSEEPVEELKGVGLPSIEEEPEVEAIELIAPPSSEELLEISPPTIEAESLVENEIIKQDAPEEIIEPEIEYSENGSRNIELPATEPEPEPEPELQSEPAPTPVSTPAPLTPESITEPTLCERGSDNPKRFKVLINEVGWMGTTNSSDDEYIEIKNIWGVPINLSGWQLLDKERQIKVVFGENNILPANGFYLLERTNDDTVPSIAADFIYTGALNNTDEALYLFNENCQLEDEVVANPNWPAGDNLLKKSMERFDLLNWYTGTNTPGSGNSPPPAIYTSTGASTPPTTPEPEPEPEVAVLSVVINEIGWMGTKANSADEWIELYNNTPLSIDLTNWTLKATDDAPSITFSTSVISAGSYFLLERTDDNTINDIAADLIYTGALSNSGEKLELRNAAGNLIDTVDCSSGWFAGVASPDYASLERINPLSGSDPDNWAGNNQVPWEGWQGKDADGNRINGTPKSQNSVSKNITAVSAGGFVIDNDLTLTLLGSPYFIEGSITVGAGAKLIIEPGVAIKFKHNTAWKSELKIKGELAAIGTETQKIIFTSSSTQPAAGDWEWLYCENASSTLKNVIIQYAGKKEGNPPFSPSYTKGAIYVDGGNIEISNSKIEESQTLGVWLVNSASATMDGVEFSNIEGDWEKAAAVYIENGSSTIRNSTFKNNNIGILIENSAGPAIENNVFENNQTPIKTSNLLASFSANTAQNNTLNGILVSGFGFSDTISEINWRKTNLPYVLESSATVSSGKTLNIEAGVVIKLKAGGRLYVDGTLTAQGTQAEKIIFTSLNQATAGSWHFIKFYASSTNSIFDNVIVQYGGWYNVFQGGAGAKSGAVKADGATLTIKNSLFEGNLYSGLELINSASEIQNTTFKEHTADYFWGQRSAGLMVKDSSPDFENTIFNNNYHGIYIESGECPDLTGVIFGEGDEVNSVDVWPAQCRL